MIFNDLLDLVNKEKRKQERARSAQTFAVGMGVAAVVGIGSGMLYALCTGEKTRGYLIKKVENTVDAIKKKTKSAKKFVDDAAKDVSDVIIDANEKRKDEERKDEERKDEEKDTQGSYEAVENKYD